MMPTMSNIQAELKKHEQWLIDLRQDSSMNLTKIQAELKTKRNVTVKYVVCKLILDLH